MNEVSIKRHNFELAKNRLKEFSEVTKSELKINKVDVDGGLFYWFDHKVTGEELNDRLGVIQKLFMDLNTTSNNVIKEFREVYNALDALDKDYITCIVANVKAIEKTSNDVRKQQELLGQHNEKLGQQQSKLNLQQNKIDKNVKNIEKIVNVLKVFKSKLEGFEHLGDIDKIWNNCKQIQNESKLISNNISRLSKKIDDDIVSINKKYISLSDKFKEELSEVRNQNQELSQGLKNQINIVDNNTTIISKDLSACTKKIESILNLLDCQINTVKSMSLFIESLKTIEHISDIDYIFLEVNKHSKKIDESNDRITGIVTDIQKNKDDMRIILENTVQLNEVKIESLKKKVQFTYLISSCLAVLVIIELAILIMKVI